MLHTGGETELSVTAGADQSLLALFLCDRDRATPLRVDRPYSGTEPCLSNFSRNPFTYHIPNISHGCRSTKSARQHDSNIPAALP